jgi:hypothetical protein
MGNGVEGTLDHPKSACQRSGCEVADTPVDGVQAVPGRAQPAVLVGVLVHPRVGTLLGGRVHFVQAAFHASHHVALVSPACEGVVPLVVGLPAALTGRVSDLLVLLPRVPPAPATRVVALNNSLHGLVAC